MARRWAANVAEVRAEPPVLPVDLVDAVDRLSGRFLAGREPLFTDRGTQGRIVDGHGDLITDDVFCLDDGPRALDCLEFDDRLRYVDGLDDVAFLAMDLERLGRPDLAEAWLDAYVEFSADPAPSALRHHYVAYRAVRPGQGRLPAHACRATPMPPPTPTGTPSSPGGTWRAGRCGWRWSAGCPARARRPSPAGWPTAPAPSCSPATVCARSSPGSIRMTTRPPLTARASTARLAPTRCTGSCCTGPARCWPAGSRWSSTPRGPVGDTVERPRSWPGTPTAISSSCTARRHRRWRGNGWSPGRVRHRMRPPRSPPPWPRPPIRGPRRESS